MILLLLATAAIGGEDGESVEDTGSVEDMGSEESKESQESQEEGVEEEGYMLAGDVFRSSILSKCHLHSQAA